MYPYNRQQLSLSCGARLGPYEVLAPVGAGGMGEVYRARDPRLGRDVAIKVLPAAFSADPERLHRFEQEARAAAALNHPNILAVHDIGQHDGSPYIVSELLEGETLRERLSGGALPVRKAVEYAVQIAHGLAAAHEKGITHRDLKPENVFVTSDGRVKILDFGLAKLTQAEPALAGASALPTTPPDTLPGVVLGTIGYMAPEQVRGLPADHRSDIFALGAILYEVLSGQRAFRGETTADTMGAILMKDPPDLQAVEQHIPPALGRIIDRCLEKNPAARFQSTRDLAFALEALTSYSDSTKAVASVPARKTRDRLTWAIGAITTLLVVAMAAPTFLYFRGPPAPDEMRFLVSVPTMQNPAVLTVSPDGRWIAFVAAASAGTTSLFIRPIDSVTPQQVSGTEGSTPIGPAGTGITGTPFWSRDSRSIAFVTGRRLKKVDVSGGPPQDLCELSNFQGGTWNNEGVIVFGSDTGLHRVSAAGGEPARITALDPSQQETAHTAPYFLPDGRHYLYSTMSRQGSTASYVGSLDSKERTRLFVAQSNAVYAEPGYLLFHREGTLFAQPFDANRLKLTGEPVRIVDEVAYSAGNMQAAFAVSENGVLVYRVGSGSAAASQFLWFDRAGKRLGSAGEPEGYTPYFDLSPDGKLIAVSQRDSANSAGDIWLIDWVRGVRTRFTFDSSVTTDGQRDVVWSPDGLRLAFSSFKKGNRDVVVKNASGLGEETPLLASPNREVLEDWSKDGRYIVYGLDSGPNSTPAQDLYVLPLFGDRKPIPIVQSPFQENEAHFSFDGKWLAYDSNESGRFQIYVISFPVLDQKRQISTNGGGQPRWRRDGKELYYLAADGKLMAVDITAGAKIDSGTPRELFDTELTLSPLQDQYRVTPDGQRFLVLKPLTEATPTPITVVVNWTAGLRK